MSTILSESSATTAYYDDTISQYLRRWCAGTGMCHFGYTNEYAPTHAETLRNTVRSVLSLGNLTPPSNHPLTILDAGCGLGGTAAYVANVLDAQVTGITLSRAQYSYARRTYGFHRPQAPDRGRATFLVADMVATPFPPNSFDGVMAIESACHVPTRQWVAEVYRLLKPGGVLVMADGMWQADSTAEDQALYDAWRSDWHVHQLQTLTSWHDHFDAAGLTHIATADWTDAMTPSIHRLGRQARLAYPVAKLLHHGHHLTDSQWANVRGAMRWDRLVRRGLCGYGAVVGYKPQ